MCELLLYSVEIRTHTKINSEKVFFFFETPTTPEIWCGAVECGARIINMTRIIKMIIIITNNLK